MPPSSSELEFVGHRIDRFFHQRILTLVLPRPLTLAMALAVAVLLPTRAHAVGIGVDVGAGAWVLEGLQADVHFRIDQQLMEIVKIGLRPGLGIAQYQPTSRLLVPLDAYVNLKLAIVYLEVLGGIYWIPSHVDPIRAHFAGGLGVEIWKFKVGIEVGYLQPSVNILGRVGFTFF